MFRVVVFFISMLDFKHERLLVIAPHPDDEVLGCGGLIKRIKEEGGKVYVLFITIGNTKEYSKNGNSTIQERMKEIEKVAKFLKYDDYRIVFKGDRFHLKLDQLPQKDLMSEIENGQKVSLNKTKPTIVALPYLTDYNQDHRSVSQAVLASVRPAPPDIKPLQRTILGFESVPTADWWHTPRNINFFVSLSDNDLKVKISALKIYKSQLRIGYHTRSIWAMKNLAYFRGMQIGERSAEAFYCYRDIV